MGKRIVIIGGGAAGLMAAGIAGENGNEVILLEKNSRPARKVMITGKGRCNVTNNTSVEGLIKAVNKNGKFLYSAFSDFSADDTINFFESRGVELKTERGNRVFPCSDKSVDIVDALVEYAKGNSTIINSVASEIVVKDKKVVGVKDENGHVYDCDAVILATGGLSYPTTGSTGDGYRMASELGHTVTKLKPSLVGVECAEGFCTRLQGLSLKNISIKVFKENDKKQIYSDFGELLFTHFGISGPTVLSASAKMTDLPETKYKVVIDLKPALSFDELDNRILRDFGANINKDFQNSLDDLLPRKLIPIIVSLSKIPPNIKVNQISKEQRLSLVNVLKNLTVTVTDFRPVEEAVITSGGISLKEVNPKTMQSKLIDGLYFAGEILDLDACTGGFNLQIAFSTGYVAGKSI